MKKIKRQLTSENESNVLVTGAGEVVAAWTLRHWRLFNWQRHLDYISINLVTLKPKTSFVIRVPKRIQWHHRLHHMWGNVFIIFVDQRIYTQIKRKNDSILSQWGIKQDFYISYFHYVRSSSRNNFPPLWNCTSGNVLLQGEVLHSRTHSPCRAHRLVTVLTIDSPIL